MRAIGIDIGTTSICLIYLDEDEKQLPLVLSRKNVFLQDTFTQDPDAIVEKVRDMLAEAEECGYGAETADVIGISAQMHGILYVDENGAAVSPFYTWKDENGKRLRKHGESFEEYLRESTAMALYSGFGTVTHFYLQEQGLIPERAVKMVNIGDYLAMCLTGRKSPVMDESIAASFGGYDLEKGDFAWERLEKAGVDTSFYPEQSRAGEWVGMYGEVPVSCAFGDNQASVNAALGKPEKQISINVGTGSQVSLFDSRLMAVKTAEIRPFFHKGYLYVGASLNGGKVYEKLAAFFEETIYEFTGLKIQAFDQMARLAQERIETELQIRPSLYGARGGLGDKSRGGNIENLTIDTFHPSDFIRAYVKGMAEELHGMYLEFPEEIRRGRTEIAASGNGIRRNPVMAEEIEKAFGLPVVFLETEEEAAAGAAGAAIAMRREQKESG